MCKLDWIFCPYSRTTFMRAVYCIVMLALASMLVTIIVTASRKSPPKKEILVDDNTVTSNQTNMVDTAMDTSESMNSPPKNEAVNPKIGKGRFAYHSTLLKSTTTSTINPLANLGPGDNVITVHLSPLALEMKIICHAPLSLEECYHFLNKRGFPENLENIKNNAAGGTGGDLRENIRVLSDEKVMHIYLNEY